MMFFSKLVNPLGLAALAASVSASPVAPAVGLADLAVVRAAPPAINVDRLESRRILVDARTVNEKRTSATFDLGHSWSDETLFDGHFADGTGGTVGLNVVCKTCYTKGSIAASLTNLEEFKPDLRIDFAGLEAYVDLAVAVSDSVTYTVNLFTSNTPIGFGVAGIDAGIIFAVDLVFSLSAAIDISGGGFYVTLPAGAYVEASLAEGEVSGSFFTGISAKTLPVTVSSGTATFKCDLRLRTQAGVEGDLVVIGAGLVAGVYINIIELVTIIETSEKCGLQCREFIDLNVGAYARAAIEIDYKTIGYAPTVSTTLFSLPTATQCIGAIISDVVSVIGGGSGSGSGVGSLSAGLSVGITASGGFSVGATATAGLSATATASLGLGGDGARLGNSTLSFVGASSGKHIALSTASATVSSAASSVAESVATESASSFVAASSAASSAVFSAVSSAVSSTGSAVVTDVASITATAEGGLVTSTVLTTKTYTITSCKATVVNCPASMQTAITVTQTYTNEHTKAPVTAAAATTTSTSAPVAATTPVITDVIVLVPCPTPIVNTFFFPSTTTGYTAIGVKVPAASAVTTAAAVFTAPAAAAAAAVGTGAAGAGASAGFTFTASKNGTLSGTYAPTASVTGSTVVTAGASLAKLSSSLAAAAGVFAAAMLL